MRGAFICLACLVVSCASTQEKTVKQLVHDNGADEGFSFGWYHDSKALHEFEADARDCAAPWSDPTFLKRATVTAGITECLIEKGWRLDGLQEIIVL